MGVWEQVGGVLPGMGVLVQGKECQVVRKGKVTGQKIPPKKQRQGKKVRKKIALRAGVLGGGNFGQVG